MSRVETFFIPWTPFLLRSFVGCRNWAQCSVEYILVTTQFLVQPMNYKKIVHPDIASSKFQNMDCQDFWHFKVSAMKRSPEESDSVLDVFKEVLRSPLGLCEVLNGPGPNVSTIPIMATGWL